ncbi:glycosyltransferase [Candidatus Woesebacteria bacterium]|nr:glycosyltransferase [Candidatus Woesebacteria bacterium]
MKTQNPYLSVIIPAFNEEKSLDRGVLGEVYSYLNKQKFTWEVLVVSDGSTDLTDKIVTNFVKAHKGFYLLKEPHRGKGGTVISGSLSAKGKIILFTDMDLWLCGLEIFGS